MMWCCTSPSKGLVINLGCFVFGVSLFVTGAHLSFKNVAPQQARIKARSDLLKAHLRKKFGYGEDLKPLKKPPQSKTGVPSSTTTQQQTSS